MEFDSEVLVNKAPTLQLANGKTATFMTQYDTKLSLFTIDPEDMGQRITGLAEGAIESMHNLPVSLAGSKLSDGINGSEAAIHEFQSSQVVLMLRKPQWQRYQSTLDHWQQ